MEWVVVGTIVSVVLYLKGDFLFVLLSKRHCKYFLVIFVLFMNYILLPKNEG